MGTDGEKLGAVVVMRDITEQKQAQTILIQQTQELTRSKEAFEQQSRILKSILDSMGDGVIVAHEEGKLLFIKLAAEQIIGISPAETNADRQIEQFCAYLPAMLTPGPQNQPPLVRAMRGEAFSAIEVLMNQ
jgi:PAS domain-containing protein